MKKTLIVDGHPYLYPASFYPQTGAGLLAQSLLRPGFTQDQMIQALDDEVLYCADQ